MPGKYEVQIAAFGHIVVACIKRNGQMMGGASSDTATNALKEAIKVTRSVRPVHLRQFG